MKGTFYGVSAGPGDPELMTVKAVKRLETVPVIAAPRTKGRNCLALDIVGKAVNLEGKEIIYLDFAMSRDAEILKRARRASADKVISRLESGLDVAMINLGDASLYGTWGYIRDLVKEAGFDTVTIPGVTSFCAAAASLDRSLTEPSLPMTVIPGSCKSFSEHLKSPGTKVLMKSASALPEVKRLIEEAGLYEKAAAVADCGLPSQRVFENLDALSDEESYYLTILIK